MRIKEVGNVLVAGLMVMDIVVKPVDAKLFERDTTHVANMEFLTGGDALNVAVNLAKLGENVRACALVGEDSAGALIRRTLAQSGADCAGILVDPAVHTSVSIVMNRPDGERHFVCHLDSTERYDASNISDADLHDARALYIGSMMALPGLEGGVLKALFERCKAHGVLTAMDATASTDGRWLERIEDVLALTDVFVPSRGEAERITGTQDPVQAAQFLRDCGVCVTGVKLGERGCYIDDGVSPFFLPAIRCENPVDLTGAGDAFMSGFLYGILRGWSTSASARFATGMSYSTIQLLGASTHSPTVESILQYAKLLDQNP